LLGLGIAQGLHLGGTLCLDQGLQALHAGFAGLPAGLDALAQFEDRLARLFVIEQAGVRDALYQAAAQDQQPQDADHAGANGCRAHR